MKCVVCGRLGSPGICGDIILSPRPGTLGTWGEAVGAGLGYSLLWATQASLTLPRGEGAWERGRGCLGLPTGGARAGGTRQGLVEKARPPCLLCRPGAWPQLPGRAGGPAGPVPPSHSWPPPLHPCGRGMGSCSCHRRGEATPQLTRAEVPAQVSWLSTASHNTLTHRVQAAVTAAATLLWVAVALRGLACPWVLVPPRLSVASGGSELLPSPGLAARRRLNLGQPCRGGRSGEPLQHRTGDPGHVP